MIGSDGDVQCMVRDGQQTRHVCSAGAECSLRARVVYILHRVRTGEGIVVSAV